MDDSILILQIVKYISHVYVRDCTILASARGLCLARRLYTSLYIRLTQNAPSDSPRLVGVGFLVYSKFEIIW